MRTLIAIIATVALASPAAAYCFPVPDTQATGFVANDLARTICFQDELAATTAQRAAQAQVQARLDQLQRDALQQRLQLQQLQAQQLLLQNKLLQQQNQQRLY
jgi:hypothetical protein